MKALPLLAATLTLTAGWVAAATAQEGKQYRPDTTSMHRWHFEGRVSGIEPANHQLLIEAQPAPAGGAVMTVPYRLRDTMEIVKYHVGDRVVGDVVTRLHRTDIEKVRLAGDASRKGGVNTPLDVGTPERWQFVGKVAGIDAASHQVVIEAQRAPGAGPVMTVPYRLRDGAEVALYHVGDQVKGDIVTSSERTYVENVRPATRPR
jgi:Cu/Ag efflux protein CusF